MEWQSFAKLKFWTTLAQFLPTFFTESYHKYEEMMMVTVRATHSSDTEH